MHCGYVIKVEKLVKHPNADKLQLLEVFGNQTCVSLDIKLNDIGIYFPSDLQLSKEYCEYNHLCRKNLAGEPDTGYMDPDKRNVKTIRLRGEVSDGIYMPLDSLAFTGVDLNTLTVGTTIDVVNGVEICKKYISRRTNRNGAAVGQGNRTRKKKTPVAPLFAEHADTEQLAYNLSAFKPGDEIEITLKMHGTSQRTGYLPVLKGYKKGFWDYFFGREGKPVYDWGYVSGTRRVVLEDYEGGFYGDNHFREQHSKIFEGKLQKGECVYYEVVGFTSSGAPIMGDGKNSKVGPEFVKQYGETTTFSYGCSPTGYNQDEWCDNEHFEKVPQSDIYVYRMTMTNEDGFVVEYTPDFMRYRCEQMGVKTVPVLWKCTIPNYELLNGEHNLLNEPWTAGDWIKCVAERYYDGPDPIGKTHTREGVVVRILNRSKFCAYKHKNTEFKILEGIIKETAAAPDMEEAQEEEGAEV